MNAPPPASPATISPPDAAISWRDLAVVAAIIAAVLAYAVNLSDPWESDQAPKAAQILEVAQRHDYFLSAELPDCYRLRLFPLYYSVSGLLYTAIGGEIFTFMNVSSVVVGVVAGLALSVALRRAFGIRPMWTAVVLVAMPLFVINCSYGNEVSWAMAFFFISLALVAGPSAASHYAGGAAVAAALCCRLDILFLAPFWLAWTALFCRTPVVEPWVKRLLRPAAAFIATEALLWLLLVRQIPETPTSFEFGFNPMLLVAYLTFPFNPSVVLIAALGWLLLLRRHPRYAWAHLLLLVPLAFYARNLSTPKYLSGLLVFYGMPTAWLLHEVRPRFKAALLAAIGLWAFVGVSNYGVFGPRQASLWYVPTGDGPCPIGGYVDFYRQARQGAYQVKQVSHIDLLREFIEPAKSLPASYRIVGAWHHQAVTLLRARGELGSPEDEARLNDLFERSQKPIEAPTADERYLLNLAGYTDLAHLSEGLAQPLRDWMANGQLRPLRPQDDRPLPGWIEIGDHIPAGENAALGQRLMFVNRHYQDQMVLEQPKFIPAYRSTAWLPRSADAQPPAGAEALYSDDAVVVFDKPVAGARFYGYVWPARYYKMKSPKAKFQRTAKP